MHKYMRAIGFSDMGDRKKQQALITSVIMNAEERAYTSKGDDMIYAEFDQEFAKDVGIAVCGAFDEEEKFSYDYYYPYLRGSRVSSIEDVSIERHAAKESYAGICDDVKVGVSLIFYLQNIIPYIKAEQTGSLPVRGTSLTLSALSIQGTVILPVKKSKSQESRIRKETQERNRLLVKARGGNEEAIEELTLSDMDALSLISKKIQTRDVLTLVDSYFMPYGVECDQYSVLGDIIECRSSENSLTGEKIYVLRVNCNDLEFDVCINALDLYGEPKVGRRFKGVIWMQGYINYPA